jgi:TIR domain
LTSSKNLGVFISYRRADTAGHAGRLVEQLKSQFGDNVFLDVDSIRPGANFQEVIRETLNHCGVAVVLIGKRWLEREPSMPPFGDPADVITQEIQMALDLKLTVIPVLLDGASMPQESALPAQFKDFPKLNAIDLRHTSYERDLQALNDILVEIFGGARATAIERSLMKVYGPFLGGSFAKLYGVLVLIAFISALWGLSELTAALISLSRHGAESLASASVSDAELLKLDATLMGAMSGLLTAFLGRRSIRWWRYANVTLFMSAAEILAIALLAIIYVSQVPNGAVMDLFAQKANVRSP